MHEGWRWHIWDFFFLKFFSYSFFKLKEMVIFHFPRKRKKKIHGNDHIKSFIFTFRLYKDVNILGPWEII